MINFILNPNFLIPFLSTAGASLTVIILQAIHRIDSDRKKKLYTVAYMTVVGVRLLQSSLIIKKNTILPHINATEKILKGDQDLLEKMFLADEFDILTDGAIEFNNIPEAHRVLVGYDDIHLLQAFEALLHFNRIDSTKNCLNDFVKTNLKSGLSFRNKSHDEQIDILSTYWDYLGKLAHEEERLIAFILHIFLPRVQQYIGRMSFLLHSKKNISEQLDTANVLHEKFMNVIPGPEFFEKSVSGGIQRILKEDT